MIFQKIIQNGLYIVVSQRLFFGHSEKIMKLRNVNGKQVVSLRSVLRCTAREFGRNGALKYEAFRRKRPGRKSNFITVKKSNFIFIIN